MNKRTVVKLILISCFVTAFGVIGCAAFRDRHVIFSNYRDEQVGDIIILGTSRNILEGWDIYLCWRGTGSVEWRKYLLAFESALWRDVSIQLKKDRIEVTCKEKVIASLHTVDGSLLFPLYSPPRCCPKSQWIVHADDPFLMP